MNITAILNKDNRRDIVLYAGDEKTLSLTVYSLDEPLQSAVDMTGNTLTFNAYVDDVEYGNDYGSTVNASTSVFSIEGTEGAATTFAFSRGNTSKLKGRYKYQITKTEGDITIVLVNGALTVR